VREKQGPIAEFIVPQVHKQAFMPQGRNRALRYWENRRREKRFAADFLRAKTGSYQGQSCNSFMTTF